MLTVITNNPYRILGVYANSPMRDIVANQGKIKAFLNVGKSCDFPTDLPNLMPPVVRTADSVQDANTKLTLPNEQMKYAQFWFVKATSFDDDAFICLTAGNMGNAVEILERNDNASSLQNRIVCALIDGNKRKAVRCAERLYTDFSTEFVKMILGENATVLANDLAHSFLDVLCDEVGASQILNSIDNSEWREYVGSKCIRPLVDGIYAAVDTAKQSRGNGPDARLEAGTKLMNDTKTLLSQLCGFLSSSDLQYQMVADKLGTEILQCSIDYYNDSDDDDAAHKAMKLQKYALSIVVGQMAMDRCRQNVDILENIISELPPQEVLAEDRAIKDEIQKCRDFSDTITMLNNCRPYLRTIKSRLGASNNNYLRISTQVVGTALNIVINKVNESRYALIDDYNKIIHSAWNVIKDIDKFDMEETMKFHYNEQRAILKKLHSECLFEKFKRSFPFIFVLLIYIGSCIALSICFDGDILGGIACSTILCGMGLIIGFLRSISRRY